MKVIITGSTGMIGEGVLLECLDNPIVTSILSVSRKPTHISHHKLSEYIVSDFLNLDLNDPKLKGYDTCFYCAGVSSNGISAKEYEKITYDTTIHFAYCIDPNSSLTFIYVSGIGTDSSENGLFHWARIKGKTENELIKLPFRNVFCYRIGFVQALPKQKRIQPLYKLLSCIFPFFKTFLPNSICTMKQLALSMIELGQKGYDKNIIKVKDIKHLSKL